MTEPRVGLEPGYYLLNTDAGMAYNGRRRSGDPLGRAAIGALLRTPRLVSLDQVSKAIGLATHNVAEYQALIEGLKLARDHGIQRIRVYADSELVVDQVNGVSAVKEARLREPHKIASSLYAQFTSIRISWVPREWNAEAHRLAKDALGAVEKPRKCTEKSTPDGRAEIGQTAAVETREAPGQGREWDETSFFAKLAGRGPAEVAVARKLLEWARHHMLRFAWGHGRVDGSFVVVLDHDGEAYRPLAVYTHGRLEIWFQYLRPPFDDLALRREFLAEVNKIPGVSFADDAITRRASVPLSVFGSDPAALEALIEALEWFRLKINAQLGRY
jgi:ribonuclease HI